MSARSDTLTMPLTKLAKPTERMRAFRRKGIAVGWFARVDCLAKWEGKLARSWRTGKATSRLQPLRNGLASMDAGSVGGGDGGGHQSWCGEKDLNKCGWLGNLIGEISFIERIKAFSDEINFFISLLPR
jgi:hypothetical protein